MKLVSYNMHGFNQGKSLLEDLCCNYDIIFCQEHWLSPDFLFKLSDVATDFVCFSNSAMTDCVNNGILRGRPFGGLAVLVRNKFADKAKLVCTDSRYMAVTRGNMLFVNVYLPNNDNSEEYRSTLIDIFCAISEIIDQHSGYDVVLTGDFNFVFSNATWSFRTLTELFDEYNIKPVPLSTRSPTTYSYCHETLQHYSLIDNFCVSDGLFSAVSDMCTVEAGNNLSDHLPIEVWLDTQEVPAECSDSVRSKDTLYQLRWDKANLQQYDTYTHHYLDAIGLSYAHVFSTCSLGCSCNNLRMIDDYYRRIVSALSAAEATCVPRKKVGSYKHWWDIELHELKIKSIESHKLWIAAGRPMSGEVYDRKRVCKAQYRRSLRLHQREATCSISNDLHDCLVQKDVSNFWKTWNSKFKRHKSQNASVGGFTKNTDIANAFADNFASVCSHNSLVQNDNLRAEFLTEIIGYSCSDDPSQCLIDSVTVEMAIGKLQAGKAPGIDGVMAEHVLYCNPLISLHLLVLFNAIIKHGYVPAEFGIGVVIPLLKDDSLDSTNLDNYRGITLSPVLSKIFENCLLMRFSDYFFTSDLQFGFKRGVGCRDALSLFSSTVQYFTNNGSTVSVAALDMSKAFDRVNHYALFLKLMKRGVPICVIKLLSDWYGKVFACVKWGACLSKLVQLATGVRQGGVLSPVLFTIYVNDIISRLEDSRYGCRVDGRYVGILMYADDLLLISASCSDLRQMIAICESEMRWLDMHFNAGKSCLVRWGPRCNRLVASVTLGGTILGIANSFKYLGITFEAGLKLKVSLTSKKIKFFRAFNYIYACIGASSSPVCLCHLLQKFCVPILLYGLDAVPLSNCNIRTLLSLWRIALFKVFKLKDEPNVLYTQYCFNILPINYVLDLRKLYLLNMQRDHFIPVVRSLYAVNGSSSLNALCRKYGIADVSRSIFSKCVWNVFISSISV